MQRPWLKHLLSATTLLALAPWNIALAAGALDDLPLDKAKDVRPQDVILWDGFQATESADGKVEVTLRMTAKDDWKIYASNLKFGGPGGFSVEHVTPPSSRRFMDPISNKEVDVYEGGEFTIQLTGAPRWTGTTFPATVTYVGCTNVICLFPYTQTIDVAFVAANTATASAMTPNAAPTQGEQDDLETRLAREFAGGSLSFGMLLAIVFLGGLLSNLTPCVAPMVPITLRLLSRQGKSPYASATAYALGIVIVYSVLGLVAALSGGLFGSLLASKAFNIAFAIVMIALGVTMLGFGDFSRLQMLGNRLGAGRPSLKNTFLMGTGAGLVAAPCTGPILAALLAYTAKNNTGIGQSMALLGLYSVGFALPYVALGGAAAKVSAAKVSPLVQVGVKLLFAAVMFGLGLYYLRVPFYGAAVALRGHWREISLTLLVAGVILSLLWLILPRLQNSKASMLIPALTLGAGLFASSQWATSGSGNDVHASQVWYHTEAEALAAAAQSGKPILIDMWAEWCEACKKMDVTTFSDARVGDLISRDWVLLKLDFTESTPQNDQLQNKYGVQSLPTLMLLPPNGQLEKRQPITGYVSAPTLINSLRQFQQHRAE